MTSTMIFQIQSALILLLMYWGVYNRRQRSLHVKLMTTAIVWDLILVLQIELTRSAIATASKAMTNPWLMNFHVTIAITSVVLYFGVFYAGRKILKGDNSWRGKHKLMGITTLILRTMVLITSYLVKQ